MKYTVLIFLGLIAKSHAEQYTIEGEGHDFNFDDML